MKYQVAWEEQILNVNEYLPYDDITELGDTYE